MKTALVVLWAALSCVLPLETAAAQCTPPYFRTWLRFSDNGETCVDTVWFGFDATATYGLDTALCEIELPPPPPTGVCDVRFVNKPGREGINTPTGLGQGFKQDFRPWSRIDTFKVKFQSGDGGSTVKFRWSPGGIRSFCDSALIGGVRMDLVDSILVTNPAWSSILIIAYVRVDEVGEVPNGIPASFSLGQNYPNPFNPTTTIEFRIQSSELRTQKVSLQVYDVLGRPVATLVNGVKHPGTHMVQWDASGFGSGVYFYRLQAGEFVSTRKMLLLK